MKKTMSPPFSDLLDNARKDIFESLAVFASTFVLAGETAIMLQIGHRRSYDFDCFCQKPLSDRLLSKVRKHFGSNIIRTVDEEWMLSIRTKTGVDISFVHHPYPLLKPPVKKPLLDYFIWMI